MKSKNVSYKESVSWLFGLQKYGIKFGLSKTANLLKAFGNPHRNRRYIHIAGTNGKGSVGAMLESILMQTGLKVGFYTSPHLVSFTERFRINRELITKDQAASIISEIYEITSPKEPPTFFELTTAMTLLYFFRKDVDISIIEVGMGGRLDATNVIDPMLSIITNIGLDHQHFLGDTIIDIAKEKGGIIKKEVDLVTAVDQPPVVKLFESLCKKKGAPFWRVGKHARYRRLPSGLLGYYGLQDRFTNLTLGLKGRFQHRNAALALLAVEILKRKGISISDEAIQLGLADPLWPGRLEEVSSDPTIILDGAHNPSAMRSIAQTIGNDFHFEKLILLLGIMEDKDISNIFREIFPLADKIIYTRPTYYRAANPQYLMDVAKKFGKGGEVHFPLSKAIERARDLADKKDLILITGSLFTVGEAKSYFDPIHYPREDI
ncbi:MAG: bifunctional folylpolyglutamate synthase/dihydrofolate synthase [Deltaproteobacteria bacterium]|nr:bifunctional folylpolyglutamate synthase/dihydrofolate synthase [Deltaproteobacteria bacterium]MBW2105020.1 bifunctional folylpolyglutamate synthase/dihydrofolate synthase [Deltaproteobacteria bacterium]